MERGKTDSEIIDGWYDAGAGAGAKHPLDVFDELLATYRAAAAAELGYVHVDVDREIKERRDDMEAALDWYYDQARSE